MKRLIFMGLALCLSAYAAAAEQTLDLIAERGTVRIGYVADEAPFSSRQDGASTPAGYTIDLCNKVADAIGRKILHVKREYVETTLAGGFDAVKNGQIDLLCGAVTINLARRESVDFSQLIFLTGASALLRKDSPEYLQILFLDKRPVRAASAPPFARTIGVRSDTTTGATLREALGPDVPKTRVVDFATHEDGLKALESHKIDAYFADRALLIGLAGRAKNPSVLSIGNRLFTHEPYGIAIRRDDSSFRLLVDRALTAFYLSDDFPKLLKTYFGDEAPILRNEIMMQSIPQ